MKLEIHFPSELRVALVASPDANNATKQLLEQIDMKVSQVPAALASLKTQITKARDEIINKIAAIEVADPDLSEEGLAALNELRDLAQQLDNINPDAPVKEEPKPEEPTIGGEPIKPPAEGPGGEVPVEPAPEQPSPPVGEESPVTPDQPVLPPEGGPTPEQQRR